MSISEIKLVLIKKITDSEDQQKLLQLLQLLGRADDHSTVMDNQNGQLLNVLLQSQKVATDTPPTSQQDIDELQQSINELFQE